MTMPRPARPAPATEPAPAAGTSASSEIEAAIAAGQAEPLGQVIRYIVRCQGSWWVRANGRWLAAGTELSNLLDTEAPRLRAQDVAVGRRAAIRGAIALTRGVTSTADHSGP